MQEKFKNKYRIASNRLARYDYRLPGAYFITICTRNKEHFFGTIRNNIMCLSDIGQIVVEEWMQTAQIRQNIELGAWVVMPNHFHGIVIVKDQNILSGRDVLPKRLYTYNGKHPNMSAISPMKNSLATALRFFKRQTTIRARKTYPDFAWQRNYHDHIIRNQKSYDTITYYVIHNPELWEKDHLYEIASVSETTQHTKQ